MDVGHVVRQLRAVGADVEIADTGLLLEGTPVYLEMMRRSPAPSDLRRVVELCRQRSEGGAIRLVVCAQRASPLTISWLQSHPEMTLVLDDRVVLGGVVHRLDDARPVKPRRKGPPPYARFATARVLLFGASRKNQVHLAGLVGVTQGSVSNALRRIPETLNPGATFDDLVQDYPGPGGQVYYWWSNRPVHEQSQYLADRGALMSGDFAADRIAPWRMPERVVAYVDAPVDLSAAGYVLSDPGDYTTLVVVPSDPTLRATASAWRAEADIADPIIAAYDVLRTATTGDGDEAVEKLRDAVVRRVTEAQRG